MKNFITTKGYIVFIILSVIYLVVKYYQNIEGGGVDLNQYETELSKVIYDIYNPLNPFYSVYWFTVFPTIYFIMQKKEYQFSFALLILHIVSIIALIKIPFPFQIEIFAPTLIASWILFLINITAAFMMGKRK